MNEETIKNTILVPILKKMGFDKRGDIEYEKTLSDGKRLDMLLKKNKKNICVIECKKQGSNLKSPDIIKQAYLYAADFEIQSPYFALCDGDKFILYKTFNTRYPLYQNENLQSLLKNIDQKKKEITEIVNLLLEDKDFAFDRKGEEWYDKCLVPSIIEKPKNQTTARNFGVHPYFTRQSWDIVTSHIRAFSQEGDVVLDPFGGTGVTLNESLMNKRHGIFIDLNPITVFWRKAILNDTSINLIQKSADNIVKEYEEQIKTTEIDDVRDFLPPNIPLKLRGSTFKSLHEVFAENQLKELALLKKIILKKTKKDKQLRDNLLLVFSSCLNKKNLTFFINYQDEKPISGGHSNIFRYYGYNKPNNPTMDIDLALAFKNKIKRLINSKKETEQIHYHKPKLKYQIHRGDATDMGMLENDSIDYIYTDPPYGDKIQYLDLSIMFNAWLDLKVSDDDYQKEAIAGGRLDRSKEEYLKLIEKSIREMHRVLKKGRYLSFVFQDRSIYYFQNITSLFENAGFELFAINAQKTGKTSYKKRLSPSSTLNSQLVLVYRKKQNINETFKNKHDNWKSKLLNHIESEIKKLGGGTYDELHNSIVRHGIILGLYDPDKFDKAFEEMLKDYLLDEQQRYQINPKRGFKSDLAINERADYFISAVLQEKNQQLLYPTTDEVMERVMPSLKNGINPTDEDITDVLERTAIEHNGGWKYLGAANVQGKLF